MKKAKKSKEIPEIKIVRSPGVFNIRILGPDGKVRGKNGMDKTQVFDFYFVGLDKNLQGLREKFGNINDTFAESILEKYKTIYSKYKFKYQYVDSYGHLWEGKCAKPSDKWALEYLKKKINESK
jgi:hypothetical protein